jgi:hypothetical protein
MVAKMTNQNCGKLDGHGSFPRKMSRARSPGHLIVTPRSPHCSMSEDERPNAQSELQPGQIGVGDPDKL